MSSLLELLGRGLSSSLMDLILPGSRPLRKEEVRYLSEEVARQPEHTANKLRLAIHWDQCGKEKKARELFKEILELEPGHVEAHLAWSAMYISTGELEKGWEKLQQISNTSTDDARVLYGLGFICERQGQTEKALQYYQQATESRPYLRQGRERQAAICLVQGDYPGAIEHYQHLQKAHPEDVTIYLFLGLMHLHLQEYDHATARFERGLTIEPDNFEIHDDQVEALTRVGRYAEAIERMHEIIEKQGEFPDNYVRLADIYSKMGDDEATVRNYEKALELHPGYLEAAVKLGTQHLRMKRYYEAATNFNRSIEINDQLITAYVGLGVAQACNQQEETAADTLELAAALEPNTNLLFAEMSRLQLKIALTQKDPSDILEATQITTGRPQELDELLDIQTERHRQAVQENPNRADLHYRYGMLLRGRGETAESIKHFGQAVEINPSYIKARIKLGLALREVNRLAEGFEHLKQALELKPESAKLHYKLGLMYCDKMQFALAVEQLEMILPEHPENGDIQANLALALQNMGLIDRARASWRAVCELEPQSALAFQAQRALPILKPVQ
ncbi:tetratricopeptide repeat protein [Planctomycetota bacterium]